MLRNEVRLHVSSDDFGRTYWIGISSNGGVVGVVSLLFLVGLFKFLFLVELAVGIDEKSLFG